MAQENQQSEEKDDIDSLKREFVDLSSQLRSVNDRLKIVENKLKK